MSAALVAIALAAALPCRAERPNIQLQVEPCLRIPAEQIWGPLAVEFRGMVSAVGQELAGRMKVRVSCEPSGRARVEVSDPATRRVLSRSVELGAWGERSRPRLLAIAVAELVAESRSEPPPQPVRPPASPPETPPEPADTAPAIAPARLALPPSAERAMALGAFAVGRKIGHGPLELGAAIRFTWDAPGQIGILAELGWERGSTGTPLGKVVGDTVGAAPGFKAPWAVTLEVPRGLVALANGSPTSETVEGERVRIRFCETPPLASYLIALVCGRIEATASTTVRGVPVRTWAVPEKLALTGFGQGVAVEVLPRLEDYFGLSYAFGKLDQVAVPDFEAGAMENAGLVTYREVALLLDPGTASLAQKKRVAEVVTHELAHQWFGNWVTMKWWDDLWLNEAFATWMAFKVVDAWNPDWRMWLEFDSGKAAAMRPRAR